MQGVEWQWRAFIDGRVSEYLDRVQQVETLVASTTDRFTTQTAALVKSLIDTMLAAVVVLVGSFVVAAFTRPFNATLFRIAVLTYAGYVALFPGAVGLLAASRQLRRTRKEFDSQVRHYREVLPPAKVGDVVGGRVDAGTNGFWLWLGFVGFCYAAVFLAALLAASLIPGYVTVVTPL